VEQRGLPSSSPREIQARRRAIRAAIVPEEEMGRAVSRAAARRDDVARSDDHARAVGAFEGANYEARGSYLGRQIDCIMFSRNEVPSVPSAAERSSAFIDMYTGRGAS